MTPSQFQDILMTENAIITSGQTTSNVINVFGTSVLGFYMPAAWTTANLSFLVDDDNVGAFSAMYDFNVTAISLAVSAGIYVPVVPSMFAGVKYLKLVSSVMQGADRTIKIVLAPVFNADNVG